MRKLIVSVCIIWLALTITPSRADDPAELLNGTWQYIAAIEADRITTYDDASAMQLVILDNTWAILHKGALLPGTFENVEYNQQTNPQSLVRRTGPPPHAVGGAIWKVDGKSLMYTATPLDATGFGSTSGAIGDYEPGPPSGAAKLGDKLGDTGFGTDHRAARPPKSFSPEGTSNTQYILRRISGSTSALRQVGKW